MSFRPASKDFQQNQQFTSMALIGGINSDKDASRPLHVDLYVKGGEYIGKDLYVGGNIMGSNSTMVVVNTVIATMTTSNIINTSTIVALNNNTIILDGNVHISPNNWIVGNNSCINRIVVEKLQEKQPGQGISVIGDLHAPSSHIIIDELTGNVGTIKDFTVTGNLNLTGGTFVANNICALFSLLTDHLVQKTPKGIIVTGDLKPETDLIYNLGNATNMWGTTFTNTLNVSGSSTFQGTAVFLGNVVQVSSTQLVISDNKIVLNADALISGRDGGICIVRYQPENDAGDGDVIQDEPNENAVLAGVTSVTNLTLTPPIVRGNDYYKCWYIKMTSGAAIDQVRKISSFNGSTNEATFATPFTNLPSTSDMYSLYACVYSVAYWDESERNWNFGCTANGNSNTITLSSYSRVDTGRLTVHGNINVNSYSISNVYQLEVTKIMNETSLPLLINSPMTGINVSGNIDMQCNDINNVSNLTLDTIKIKSGGLSLNLQGNTKVSGNLTVLGIITKVQELIVCGDLVVQGQTTTVQDIVILGSIVLTDTNILGNLSVVGVTTLGQETTVNGNLTVNQGLTVIGNLNLNNTTVQGNLSVKENTKLEGGVMIGGNVLFEQKITANGESTFNADVKVNGNVAVCGNLLVTGPSTLNSNLTVGQSLNVLQKTNLNNVLISGDACVTGMVDIGDNITVGGTASIVGSTTIGGDLGITGNVSVTGTSLLTGNVTLNNISVAGKVLGNLTIDKNLTILGNIIGNTTIADSLTIKSQLTVFSQSTFNDNVTINGDLDVNGDIDVVNIYVSNDIIAAGANITASGGKFNASVLVCGNVNILGNLNVSDRTVLSDTLTVANDTFLQQQLTVTGTTTHNALVTINANLDVNGDIDVVNLHVSNDIIAAGANITASGSKFYASVLLCGNVDVSGNLNVADRTVLSDTLTVANDTLLQQNVIIGGELDISGNTNMDANLNVQDRLNVYGNGEFAENVVIQCDLSVGKDLIVNGTTTFIGTTVYNSNVDMSCKSINNVNSIHVGNVFGKSPINFFDVIHIKAQASQITFEGGIEIGNTSTTAVSSDSIAIGHNSYANTSSCAIGSDAFADDDFTIAIGMGSEALSGNATVVGHNAHGSGGLGVSAFGHNALATSFNATALGYATVASGNYSLSIGAQTQASEAGSIAIGQYANSTQNSFGIAIGAGASSGDGAVATGSSGISIGTRSKAGGASGVSIGEGAGNAGIRTIAIGLNTLNVNTGRDNVAIGGLALEMNTTSTSTVAIGSNAMAYHITGSFNTALGFSSLFRNIDGINNTVIGALAHSQGTTGNSSVAIGYKALYSASGSKNAAVGALCLANNTTASYNTAMGHLAMRFNEVGNLNAVVGFSSALNNVNGVQNAVLGARAHQQGISGNNIVSVGFKSLYNNASDNSVAVGWQALLNNTSGNKNTAVGSESGRNLTIGSRNVCFGSEAGYDITTSNENIAIGYATLNTNSVTFKVTGSNNIAMGTNAMGGTRSANSSGDNNIAMGNSSLEIITTGYDNVAIGKNTGLVATTGNRNILIGRDAGSTVTTGYQNVIVAPGTSGSVVGGKLNVVVGAAAVTGDGDWNIAIGASAVCLGPSSMTSIAIGHLAYAADGYNFEGSIAIGFQSHGYGNNCVSLGSYTVASGTYSVAIGGGNAPVDGAESTAMDSIAIGRNTLASNMNATAISLGANATGVSSLAIGVTSRALATSAVAIGESANAAVSQSTAVGSDSKASGVNSSAFGTFSNASGLNSIAIGGGGSSSDGAIANGAQGVSIGHKSGPATSTAPDNIAIGSSVMRNMTDNSSDHNIGIGDTSLYNFTSGVHIQNIAIGHEAMGGGTTKTADTQFNICVGYQSGYIIEGGDKNVIIGHQAGMLITTGVQNICIGDNVSTSATTANAIVIGTYSMGTSTDAIAIGTQSESFTRSIALGKNSNAKGPDGIFIGYNAGSTNVSATGPDNIAIGRNTLNSMTTSAALNNIAIGKITGDTITTGNNNVIIGTEADSAATTSFGVAIGYQSMCRDNSIAIGRGADSLGSGTISIGRDSYAGTNSYAIAVGGGPSADGATATGANSIAIGRNSQIKGSSGISIGYNAGSPSATATGLDNIAMGRNALNSMTGSGARYNIAIGVDAGTSLTTGYMNTIIGHKAGDAMTTQYMTVSIGAYSECLDDGGIAIGNATVSSGMWGIAIGQEAHAYTNGSIAMGLLSSVTVGGLYGIAIGQSANTISSHGIAIGSGANVSTRSPKSTGANSIAIGSGSQTINNTAAYAKGSNSIAIGGGAALNDRSYASSSDAIAIGRNTNALFADTIAIGRGATALFQDQVSIGNPIPTSSTANATVWGQIFQNRTWDDNANTIPYIDQMGNFVKDPPPGTLLNLTAETVHITANVIIDGELSGTGIRPISIIRIDKTTPQTIMSGNIDSNIQFQLIDSFSENYPGSWDGNTLTMTEEGWFHINAGYRLDDGISNKFRIEIFVNNETEHGQCQDVSTGIEAVTSVSAIKHLTIGDRVNVRATQTTGGDITIYDAHLSVHFLPGTSQVKISAIAGNVLGASYVSTNTIIPFQYDQICMVGNVKITQNLEIQGNLTIDGNLFQVAIFKVTKTASQMISNDVLTTVSFDTTDINNSGTPGTWNGTDTFTMTRPGWYNISAAYDYGTSFPNKHLLQIHINNTAVNTLGQGQLYSTGLSAQAQTQTIIHLDVGDTVKVKTHQTSGATATVSSAHLVIHYLPGTTQSAALSQIVSNIVCANVGVRTDLIQAKTSSPFGSITVVDDTQFNGNVVVSGHLRTAGTKLLRTTLQTTSVANTSSYIYNFNTPGELVIFDAFITGQEGNIGVLSGNVAMYSFRDGGVINRGGNITSFITPTKTILIEDDVTFDAAITLVGNGLQIEVTSGDLMPNVNWSIILDLKGEFAT